MQTAESDRQAENKQIMRQSHNTNRKFKQNKDLLDAEVLLPSIVPKSGNQRTIRAPPLDASSNNLRVLLNKKVDASEDRYPIGKPQSVQEMLEQVKLTKEIK